jgi:hypothetical protein
MALFAILKEMKKVVSIISILGLLFMAGLFMPLGSYTTTNGCPVDPMPTERLHMIKGDSLNEVKARKDPTGAGCTANTQYTLYFL